MRDVAAVAAMLRHVEHECMLQHVARHVAAHSATCCRQCAGGVPSWGLTGVQLAAASPQRIKAEYRRYVESGAWCCPEGGAHFWVCRNGTKQCVKCSEARQIVVPDYMWNDSAGTIGTFGVRGLFDAERRRRV